jgi:hypothetical protein
LPSEAFKGQRSPVLKTLFWNWKILT